MVPFWFQNGDRAVRRKIVGKSIFRLTSQFIDKCFDLKFEMETEAPWICLKIVSFLSC